MKETLKKILPFGKSSFQYDVAICSILKNEDPYLQEWIAYHRKIGVAHFFLYDNESTVPVERLLSDLVADKVVTVERIEGKGMQMQAYWQCLLHHGHRCHWIAFIDADEFIVPKTLSGSLPQFLQAYEKYGGLGINWLVFGSNGHMVRQSNQLPSYTKRLIKTHWVNKHIKSIVQPKYVRKKSPPKNPHEFWLIKGRYCVNENGKRIEDAFSEHSSNLIQLNHYFIRSAADIKEKQSRGRADIADSIRDINFFYELDREAMITDEAILELIKIMEETSPA